MGTKRATNTFALIRNAFARAAKLGKFVTLLEF